MTANRQIANRAQQLAKGADGLRRRACLVVAVATHETSLDAARRVLDEEIEMPDLRKAALNAARGAGRVRGGRLT